jgi:hypothetical protein
MSLTEIIRVLLEQQEEIFEILEFDERPDPRPPATAAQLEALEQWWRPRYGELPPSYKDFLSIADGIEHFSTSYHLFGSCDLLAADYPRQVNELLSDGPGFQFAPDHPPVLIASHPDTTTRLWMHPEHESKDPLEPVVLDGDPGDMTLHESFVSCLRHRIEANKMTIKTLLKMREEQE